MTVEVLDAGPFTTVQDLGRPGFAHLGVPTSGALDSLSFRIANRLAGNADGAAALEIAWRGGAFRFRRRARVVVGGDAREAWFAREAASPAVSVPAWTPTDVPAGATLTIGALASGLCAYLAVSGGFDVPRVLGSASTYATAGLGGAEGRALRAGDALPLGAAPVASPRAALSEEARGRLREALGGPVVRTTDGAHVERFSAEVLARFHAGAYRVSDRSDRMGLRLEGPPLVEKDRAAVGSLLTEGMPRGAVQVSGDGLPILLLADGPTTGGYPVIACVTTVDLPRVGQLRPRESVRFERVTLEEARGAFRDREERLDRAVPPS